MVDPREAVKAGAPQLHPEAPGNIASTGRGRCRKRGQRTRGRRDHQEAPRMSRSVTRHQSAHGRRLDGNPRRHRRHTTPRTTATRCTPARRAPTPCAARPRRSSALPNDKLRVVTEDVGGAFGMKTPFIRNISRCWSPPRKSGGRCIWQSTRSEAFITDTQAPRRRDRSRTRARRQRQISGAAHAPPVRPGRLCRQRRRQHQHQQFRALPARHVPHPQDRCRRRAAYFTNKVPIGPLPRRRTARGQLRA